LSLTFDGWIGRGNEVGDKLKFVGLLLRR